MQSNRGFSLIELMIVVAIIALVASIALPQYQSYVQKAIVSNGIQFAIEPQIEIERIVRSGGTLPSVLHSFYEDDSADAEVSGVWFYNSPVRVVINYGPGAGPRLEGRRVWRVLDASNPLRMKWTCRTHPSQNWALPDDALPKNCR